jgi:Icc-related predicted phosphoesterase
MGKNFALVASDLHLKKRTWSNRPIEGDSYFAWDQIVDTAIREAVAVVILAGDILDKQINGSGPIVKLQEGIEKLGAAGIKTLFIQGQHEYQEMPWASLSKHAIHLHRNFVEVAGYTIVGIDFQAKERLQDELSYVAETLKAPPEKTILVMHQVWEEWMGERALPQGKLADVNNWLPELGLLITGDLHESKWLGLLITGDLHESKCGFLHGQNTLSPGSTCMQSISEPEDKYMYLLSEWEEGRSGIKTNASHRSLLGRPFIDWPLFGTVADIEDCIREYYTVYEDSQSHAEQHSIPEEICKPIVRFQYDHSLSGDMHRLEKLVGDTGHIFWKDHAPKDFNEEDSVVVSDNHITMESLVQSVECDEDVRHIAERLISSGDPAEELKRWQKEQFDESH